MDKDMNMVLDMILVFADYMQVWEIIKDNSPNTNKMILCTLADAIGAQENKTGCELVNELLPVMKDVADNVGKICL